MSRYDAYAKHIVIKELQGEKPIWPVQESWFIFQFDNGEVFNFDNGEIYHVLKEGKKIVDAQIAGGKL